MSEKTPRLKQHHVTTSELARIGTGMYKPLSHPLNPGQQPHIGQMSLTSGVFISRLTPPDLLIAGLNDPARKDYPGIPPIAA